MIIAIFFIWLISSLICAGFFFAFQQGDAPSIAEEMRREDLGTSIAIGCLYGSLGPIGIIAVYCLTGFAQYKWKLFSYSITW